MNHPFNILYIIILIHNLFTPDRKKPPSNHPEHPSNCIAILFLHEAPPKNQPSNHVEPSNLPAHTYEEKIIHLYSLYILSKDINVYIDSHSDACIYERSLCLSLARICGLSCTCMDLLHAFVDCCAWVCISSCMDLLIAVHACGSLVLICGLSCRCGSLVCICGLSCTCGSHMPQPYHPAAQDWLPTEAKQGWAWSVPGWETSWEGGCWKRC